MTQYIFKLRNKKTGKFYDGSYTGFTDTGHEYSSETTARTALDAFIHYKLGNKLYNSYHRGQSHKGITQKTLAEWFPYEIEIAKFEVIHKPESVINVDSTIRNMFISNKLQDISYSLSRFWDNAIKKDYADQIEFVVKLVQQKGERRDKTVKDARTHLRNLGIKTRTFREYDGMFGFYNREQAFKARLTLDVEAFIDIVEIKKELFSD